MAEFTIVENNLATLGVIESSINAAINELIDTSYERAQLVPEGGEGNFASCKHFMTEYIEAMQKIKKYKQAFEETKESRDLFDKTFKHDFLALCEEKLKQSKAAELHPKFKMMMDAIVNTSSTATDDNVVDETVMEETDDLVLVQTNDIPLDPISRQEIVNPVHHKTCGHIYDRDSVTDYIRQNRRARCPMAGCNSNLTEDMLEDDEEVMLLMSRKRRKLNQLS